MQTSQFYLKKMQENSMQMEDALIAHYKQYFRTVNAKSQSLKDDAYRLRYEVYNYEGIISVEKFKDKAMEFDQFDTSAMHSLLIHRSSNRAIGYIRLIPYGEGDSCVERLPIEHYCENISVNQLRHRQTGELSRMLIHPDFRRRMGDQDYQSENNNPEEGNDKRFPINYLPISVALTGISLMALANLEYVAALMEPRLAIHLRRQGLFLHQFDKPVELFGHRVPFFIDTDKSCKGLKLKKPEFYELYNFIKDEYKAQM